MVLLVQACSDVTEAQPIEPTSTVHRALPPTETPLAAGLVSAVATTSAPTTEAGSRLAGSSDGSLGHGTLPPSSTEATNTVDMHATDHLAPLQEWPRFTEGLAPSWPFVGVVQLWADSRRMPSGEAGAVWWLRYWPQGLEAQAPKQVPLPGLEIECFGEIGMVSLGEGGIEVGGAPAATSGSILVRWGEAARRRVKPSEALLDEIADRPSTLEVGSAGDVVWLAADGRQASFAMRVPPRAEGDWWRVQARRDGELLVMSVHPANHRCFSGVTWLVDGSSGEVVACGANTWATRFVAPEDRMAGDLVLPDPADVGSYLDCGARLDLAHVPVRRWTR